ncbi:MAG: YvcK family protein, partial [Spiroplasma sp.]|nr:YvcK family protein [Mycoplasmatales bacterium]
MKKIVIFGGGSGLSNLLTSLKNEPLELNVVVTISDNGGSTGRIRDFYNIPAPGDLRRVVVALSTDESLKELMNYRFDKQLQKHTVGNLILAALTDIKGDIELAVIDYCKMMGVQQLVLPISKESLELVAIMKSGVEIIGESEIAKHPDEIEKIFYKGDPSSNPNVIEMVKNADGIIFSSGSLYTSIISNLIFTDLAKAICQSTAKKIYVSNLMTERGETETYYLSDHINAIEHHFGGAIDDVIVNNNFGL